MTGWAAGWAAACAGLLLACAAAATDARAELTSPVAFSRDGVPADFCKVVRQDLLDGEFTQLEATHKAAQSLEARFTGGQPELEVFYDALTKSSCTGFFATSCSDDPSFDSRKQRLQEWLDRKSDPSTANLALARFWWDAAWAARGCGFANQVTSQQWQGFFERLKLAAGYAHQIDAQSDAEAGHLLLALARDFNLPRDQIDAVFQQARRRFPTYFLTYQEYGTITLEKWSGRTDLTAPYVQSLATDPGGDTGEVAYSILAELLLYEFKADRLYGADAGFAWPKVKQAFAAREKLYGLGARDWTALCYLAYVAQDRAAARDALRQLDGKVQFWPFTGTGDFYLHVLPWIMSDEDAPASQP
ncbi:MAG TPA: hypothetical protein VHA35_13000 [Dongiaceae bacterium]|nr:hypothetical protein [Dongiaceae bacterium]